MLVAVQSVANDFSLASWLECEGFEVMVAADGQEALQLAGSSWQPDVVLLDLPLPEVDGFSICERVRATNLRAVIFVLSAGSQEDEVLSLEAGADDYVPKPFSPRELVARVKAILRRAPGRASGEHGETLAAGDVVLEHPSRTVTVGGEPVRLTTREFDLLAALLAHPNVVLSRDRLLELVWGGSYPGGTRTVDVHVAQLRRKLGRPELIETVRGIGYRVVAPR